MQKYTLAWLAFMAIERLDKGTIKKKSSPLYTKYSRTLVEWFMNYRDFVIQGSWYPAEVFDDQDSSHILKYSPVVDETSTLESISQMPVQKDMSYGTLPQYMQMKNTLAKDSILYRRVALQWKAGNLADRCNAMYHTIVDNFKIQFKGEKGSPIAPTSNHMAMRFFMMAHYIADGHMPMHCDARQLDKIQEAIATEWENAVKQSFEIDYDNNRFFYNRYGYPKKAGSGNSLIKKVEKHLSEREFGPSWGTDNKNLYDYMKVVTRYSCLMSYELFPLGYEDMDWEAYKQTEAYKNFEKYSIILLSDAIDSIARAWLKVWMDFHDWGPALKAEAAEEALAEQERQEMEAANDAEEE